MSKHPVCPTCQVPLRAVSESGHAMQPFEQARLVDGEAHAAAGSPAAVFRNDAYQVLVYRWPGVRGWPALLQLSVRRLDRQPIHDWRDLQRIKNELVGPEHEAVELYPAESRLVDSSNQYHLWCLESPTARFPFGWLERFVSDAGPTPSAPKAKQRPWPAGARPVDCRDAEEVELLAAEIRERAKRLNEQREAAEGRRKRKPW